MNTVELDIGNLKRWLPTSTVPNNSGYLVYFSDRRGDRNFDGQFNYKDTIRRNDALDTGEDFNGRGVYDDLERPAPLDVPQAQLIWQIDDQGRRVPSYLLKDVPTFRRSLRLVNGTWLPSQGLTIVSENPIYVLGNYNTVNKAPASIVADSLTMLSGNWNDARSYLENLSSRIATVTTLNTALIIGNTYSVYKSDASYVPTYSESLLSGGVHNLIRFLENWNSVTFTYLGSLVNLYRSRQGIGQWKCCQTVYSPPRRVWSFDTDFLDPAKLPPQTPNFNVIEIQRFRQDLFDPSP